MDVAIVGGGPAGLLVAERCAEAGLDVIVFEEHPAVGEPTHCTGIVSLETADFAKIPDEAILNRLSRARLHGPGGVAHELAWDGGPRLAANGMHSPEIPQALCRHRSPRRAAGAGHRSLNLPEKAA